MSSDTVDRRSWRDRLQITSQGVTKGNLFNACLAIRMHPDVAGQLGYNEFASCSWARGPLPWDERADRPWSEHDDLACTEWLQNQEVGVGSGIAREAVQRVGYENRFHPVLEWLEGLTWDGTERLSGWLTTYLGVPQSSLSDAIGRKFLISAVARVYKPGIKVDHLLIMEGRQGMMKSTALRTLVGDDWFADQIADLGTKNSSQDLRGKWLIELSERSAIRPGEVEKVKAYVSRQVDHYRASYGRRTGDVPRQCVFAGTTNADAYLNDETGGRRFWPVTCTSINIKELARDREQLWAEAVAAYHAAETWWLDDDVLRAAAEDEQEDRRQRDPWEALVAPFLDGKTETTIGDMLTHLEKPADPTDPRAIPRAAIHRTKGEEMRAAKVLRALDWTKKERAGKGARAVVWKRHTSEARRHTSEQAGVTPETRGFRTSDTPSHLDTPDSRMYVRQCNKQPMHDTPRGVSGVTPAERQLVGTCAHCRFTVFVDNHVRTESGALLHQPCVEYWAGP